MLESVNPTDRHGRDAPDVCNLSRCEQLVRWPTHIAANRLKLLITDAADIVDCVRWYSTGHFSSLLCQLCDSCWAICSERQCRNYCFLNRCTIRDGVRSAVRSLICMEHHFEVSWSIIDAFYRAIGEVIGRYVSTTVLRSWSGSGDKQLFDASCWRAHDAKRTAYRVWCRACSADHWVRFVLARAQAKRVYSAARESHNERTRNTLKNSCSYKW